MRRWIFTALLLGPVGVSAECELSTSALDSMSSAELVLAGPGGRSVELAVRIADDFRERAGGFQHVCPETVDKTAIYFQFDQPRRPSFHMRNVKAPLDIAFIDDRGVLVDIQLMDPHVLGSTQYTYYSPPEDVVAALETRAGYFSDQGIAAETWKVEALGR